MLYCCDSLLTGSESGPTRIKRSLGQWDCGPDTSKRLEEKPKGFLNCKKQNTRNEVLHMIFNGKNYFENWWHAYEDRLEWFRFFSTSTSPVHASLARALSFDIPLPYPRSLLLQSSALMRKWWAFECWRQGERCIRERLALIDAR